MRSRRTCARIPFAAWVDARWVDPAYNDPPSEEEPVYGDKLASYGSEMCALCGKVHDKAAWIEESGKSRFKMLQFAAELATIDKTQDTNRSQGFAQGVQAQIKKLGVNEPSKEELAAAKLAVFKSQLAKSPYQIKTPKPPSGIQISVTSEFEETRYWNPATEKLVDGKNMVQTLSAIQEQGSRKDWAGMLGLLTTPESTYVSAAGTFAAKTNGLFGYVAKKLGYKVCDKTTKGDTPSISGVNISRQLYENTRVDNVPGSCAAPKLIQQYIADKIKSRGQIDVSQIHMSEIYFVPDTDKNTEMTQSEGGLYWTPGLTAHSCKTCNKLLPMLLCPSRG
jgi:hypothetical protein